MNQFFTKQQDMMKSLKDPLDSQAAQQGPKETNDRRSKLSKSVCVGIVASKIFIK